MCLSGAAAPKDDDIEDRPKKKPKRNSNTRTEEEERVRLGLPKLDHYTATQLHGIS